MFKYRLRAKEFFKKNVAMILAIAMLLSSFASTGMAINSAFADSTTEAQALAEKGDSGENFVNELLEIVTEHVPYVWGGWQRDPDGPRGVDCRGYVRVALRDTYGLNIFETVGYLVNADGTPKLNSKGERTYLDVAAYDAEDEFRKYVGEYICVEGNGIKTYYQVLCSGTCSDINNDTYQNNVLDIPFNNHTYSSLIAYACQFPGTIISHNGHYGVGLGQFDSKADLLEAYPELDTYNSGINPDEGVIRWSDAAYNLGNTYSESDLRYYFGKTVFISACSSNSGIRADNFTTTGKDNNPSKSSEITILMCLQSVKTTNVYFDKYDATDNGIRVGGAKYGIYKDAACQYKIDEFTTSATGSTQKTLTRGTYYVKEISAPSGYSKSNTVTVVDATGADDVYVRLQDNPVNSTLLVRKVDANDSSKYLSDATLVVQERNASGKYEDLVTLSYDSNVRGYVINSTYTNNEGKDYSDNALHYSQTNKGYFKIIETQAPQGYVNDWDGYEFNLTSLNGSQLLLIEENAVQNRAMLQLKVQKYISGTNTGLNGCEFTFTYTDKNGNVQSQTKTTARVDGQDGVIVFDAIEEGSVATGYLKENSCPNGYTIPGNYSNGQGQQIALTKNTLNDDRTAFLTTIKVNNIPENTSVETVESGNITIKKYDVSNPLDNLLVNDSYYNVYTDQACTQIAVAIDGVTRMERLKTGTDGSGTVIAKDLPLGVYYIKEVEAPYNYELSTTVYPINLLADNAVNGVLNETVRCNELRQIVEINVSKTDSVSNLPVPNAVYALWSRSDLMLIESLTVVEKDTLLGYYKTDENGNIRIININTDSIVINGEELYKPVVLVDNNGDPISIFEYPQLPNGIYELQEVYTPEGYVTSAPITINADWQQNTGSTDKVISDNGVSEVTVTAGGYSIMVDIDIKEERQTVEFSFIKKDSVASSMSFWYPYLNSAQYADAVALGQAATLQGAAYQVYTDSDIYDINTGSLIPAGTLIGTYETDSSGRFDVKEMTVGDYKGHKLPSGNYKIVELNPSQGYELNTTPYYVSLPWSIFNASTKTLTLDSGDVVGTENILMQSLLIKKVDENGNALKDAEFAIYRVADILSACNITTDELPWDTTAQQVNGFYPLDREDLLTLIEDNDVSKANDMGANVSWITDENGLIVTEKFVYGDYIVVETNPPLGYLPSNATYVQLPWVVDEVAIGSQDGTGASYIHDVTVSPSVAYEMTVVNELETINFIVTKQWEDNNDALGLRPDSVTVYLYDNNANTGVILGTAVLNDDNNWTYEFTNLPMRNATDKNVIDYAVREKTEDTENPDSVKWTQWYESSVDGGMITNTLTYEMPKTQFTVTKVWDDRGITDYRPESIEVQLFANGNNMGDNYKVTLNAENNWTYTWSDLNQKDHPEESDIVYTVDEISSIEGYVKSFGNEPGVIINTLTTEPTVQFTAYKQWVHNGNTNKPTSVELQLYRNGEKLYEPVTVSGDGDTWSYTWTLNKYDENGSLYVYTVDEVNVPRYYEKSISADGTTVTNTYNEPERISYTATKVWDDEDNKYNSRPTTVSLTLLANGQVEKTLTMPVNETNTITFKWDNLLKLVEGDGEEIVYSVAEPNVAQGYVSSVNETTVTNTYVPTNTVIVKYTEINGNKVTLAGATLKLVDADGNTIVVGQEICEWVTASSYNTQDSDGLSGLLIKGLKPGTYTLVETQAPDGYVTAESQQIVVTDTDELQFFYMKNTQTVVSISKVDAENGMRISGAKLTLIHDNGDAVIDSNGNAITWTSTTAAKVIHGLPVGTYYVSETNAPFGYQKADDLKIHVQDVSTVQAFTMQDDRTYGSVEITKIDGDTNETLSDVELQIKSIEKVIDPVGGNTIYEEGQIVATITTDKNGIAKLTNNIQAFTYAADGTVKAIKYVIVETKAPVGGQYDADNVSVPFTFEYKDDETPVVSAERTISNYKPYVKVTKTGEPKTYVGDYESKDNITVVNNGDFIVYTIKVENTGSVSAWQVIVRDKVPANTQFVSFADNNPVVGTIDTDGNIKWVIDELKANNEPVELSFTVKVNSKSACEIVNIAEYVMPDSKPAEGELFVPDENTKWNETDAVVHQVITFDKTSTINGGTDKTNATAVSVGDVITYHLTLNTIDTVYNAQVIDKIPVGLTYVVGSAKINGKVDADVSYKDNVLTFSTIDALGQYVFEFDVVVDDVPVGSGTTYYENIASVNYSNAGSTNTLTSAVVTHKTEKDLSVIKTATPNTYVGDAENATNVTVLKATDVVEYTLTIKNNGNSVIKNAIVVDTVPDGLTYINNTTPDGVKVWVDGDKLTWVVPELNKDDEVNVVFTAKVTEQKAQLIVNAAYYNTVQNVGEDAPVLPENSKKTNDVVHQVIEFHKTSDVKGGNNKENATAVSVGDTITYTLELVTKHDLTNVTFEDPVPNGLKFVDDSLMFKTDKDTEWKSLKDFIGNSDSASFETGLSVGAGRFYVKFDTVVEKIPVNSEAFYLNQATVTCDKFTGTKDSEKTSLKSEEVTHMTSVIVDGNKTSEGTYVGDYDSRHNVAVIKDEDEIVYTITVKNTGLSTINGLVIKDKVPEFTKFVSADNNGKLDAETNTVTWVLNNIKPEESAVVVMKVVCNTNGLAKEIRNVAAYAVPKDVNNVTDEEWLWTDEVIHQTVSLTKNASIDSGITISDAKYVKIGTQFTYIITFESTNTVYNLQVSDKIPDGLKYVANTAKYTICGQDTVLADAIDIGQNNDIVFPIISEVPAGQSTFIFDVTVEDVPEYDKEFYYVNQANALLTKSKDSDKGVELTTNTVSHKTEKTNAIDTPKLGFESTSPTVMWSVIAVVSAIASAVLGWYGLKDRKKKK